MVTFLTTTHLTIRTILAQEVHPITSRNRSSSFSRTGASSVALPEALRHAAPFPKVLPQVLPVSTPLCSMSNECHVKVMIFSPLEHAVCCGISHGWLSIHQFVLSSMSPRLGIATRFTGNV